MEETEVPCNFPEKLLDCNDYRLELTTCTDKRRVGTYIRNGTEYVRRKDLEKTDSHVIIIDVSVNIKLRIINMYRSFRPLGGVGVSDVFLK